MLSVAILISNIYHFIWRLTFTLLATVLFAQVSTRHRPNAAGCYHGSILKLSQADFRGSLESNSVVCERIPGQCAPVGEFRFVDLAAR